MQYNTRRARLNSLLLPYNINNSRLHTRHTILTTHQSRDTYLPVSPYDILSTISRCVSVQSSQFPPIKTGYHIPRVGFICCKLASHTLSLLLFEHPFCAEVTVDLVKMNHSYSSYRYFILRDNKISC